MQVEWYADTAKRKSPNPKIGKGEEKANPAEPEGAFQFIWLANYTRQPFISGTQFRVH